MQTLSVVVPENLFKPWKMPKQKAIHDINSYLIIVQTINSYLTRSIFLFYFTIIYPDSSWSLVIQYLVDNLPIGSIMSVEVLQYHLVYVLGFGRVGTGVSHGATASVQVLPHHHRYLPYTCECRMFEVSNSKYMQQLSNSSIIVYAEPHVRPKKLNT